MPRARGPHPLPLLLALAMREATGVPGGLPAFLAGLARYQQAPHRPPRPEGETVARIGTVRLLRCGGPAQGPRVLLVPSIINGGEVLDLLPGNSLVEALAARGIRVWRIDWGGLDRGERRLGLAGLVSTRLVPLAGSVPAPFALAGYCLGGTLALGAAAHLETALGQLILIATPWRFAGYGEAMRSRAAGAWRLLRPLAQSLGAAPLSALNPLFWSLDEAGVVAKFAALGRKAPPPADLALFAAVEDWASNGPAIAPPALRDILLRGLGHDMFARGRWRVRGRPVRPETLGLPILEIGATRDRLVPPAARPAGWPGLASVTLEGGHVGMIVGSRRGRLVEALALALANA